MMNTILREWRGRVPASRADAYLDVLRATGLKQYAATPGHRGTLVLRSDGDAETEYVLLTFWDSEEAVRRFSGDDIDRAIYYPEDEGYLVEKPERLRHFRVVESRGPSLDAPEPGAGEAWPPLANWR